MEGAEQIEVDERVGAGLGCLRRVWRNDERNSPCAGSREPPRGRGLLSCASVLDVAVGLGVRGGRGGRHAPHRRHDPAFRGRDMQRPGWRRGRESFDALRFSTGPGAPVRFGRSEVFDSFIEGFDIRASTLGVLFDFGFSSSARSWTRGGNAAVAAR